MHFSMIAVFQFNYKRLLSIVSHAISYHLLNHLSLSMGIDTSMVPIRCGHYFNRWFGFGCFIQNQINIDKRSQHLAMHSQQHTKNIFHRTIKMKMRIINIQRVKFYIIIVKDKMKNRGTNNAKITGREWMENKRILWVL